MQSKALRIAIHEDPGHAWGEVPIKLLRELGIADQISAFSYRRGDLAYLEEDCDLSLFARTAEAAGYAITWDEEHFTNHESPIRHFRGYREVAR